MRTLGTLLITCWLLLFATTKAQAVQPCVSNVVFVVNSNLTCAANAAIVVTDSFGYQQSPYPDSYTYPMNAFPSYGDTNYCSGGGEYWHIGFVLTKGCCPTTGEMKLGTIKYHRAGVLEYTDVMIPQGCEWGMWVVHNPAPPNNPCGSVQVCMTARGNCSEAE